MTSSSQPLGARLSDPRAGRRRPGLHTGPAVPVAWVALALVAALVDLHVTRGTTFNGDEWVWALNRRGSSPSVLLDTYNGHFSLVPLLIYRGLWAVFGLRTYVPYRVLVVALHLAVSTLVLLYARRRVGEQAGLAAAALVLFFGPGWQEFLWPFQIAWLISVGAGIGALLALDSERRGAPAAASGLIALALASSGPGVAVAGGVGLELLLRRAPRRLWIVIGPGVLYALWWVGYQHTAVSRYTVEHTPQFVLRLLLATLGSLSALWRAGPAGAAPGLGVGAVLLALGLAAAAWRLAQVHRLWPRALALPAIVLLFGISAGVSRAGFGSGVDSRYLYVAAVFIVLTAVELARGVHLPVALATLLALLVAAAAAANATLVGPAGAYLRAQAGLTRADLGALEIARGIAGPDYVAAHFPGWPFVVIRAGSYYAAARSLGTPAADVAQLRRLPEPARETADVELIAIHAIRLQPGTSAPVGGHPPLPLAVRIGGAEDTRRCTRWQPTGNRRSASLIVVIPARGLTLAAGAGLTTVSLRRFAAAFTPIGAFAGPGTRRLAIAPDRSLQPWQARIATTGPALICPAAGAGRHRPSGGRAARA
jgi:hypothetical protein